MCLPYFTPFKSFRGYFKQHANTLTKEKYQNINQNQAFYITLQETGYSRRTKTSAKMKNTSGKDMPTFFTASGQTSGEPSRERYSRRHTNMASGLPLPTLWHASAIVASGVPLPMNLMPTQSVASVMPLLTFFLQRLLCVRTPFPNISYAS